MSTIIQLKRNSTAGASPASLNEGELAINVVDKILYSSNGTSVFVVRTPSSGSNTQVQFNDSGFDNGDVNLTYDKTTGTLSTTLGNFSSAVNVGSNVNISTTRLIIGNSSVNVFVNSSTVDVSSNTLNLGTANISTNGFSWLPNGLLMQWGWVSANSSAGSVTFPVAFPTACFGVQATSNSATTTAGVDAVTAFTTTTATVKTANATSSNVHWLAVGH